MTVGTNISYQWEESPDGIGSWGNVLGGSGATDRFYTTTVDHGYALLPYPHGLLYRPDSNNSNVATVSVTAGGIDEDFHLET
ncbi:MAG: hypothetical protein IPI91_03945 [Flavobacteriales bacterium]|nr:hypothetical protein [Flavobacteriales bacterium]